MKIYLFKTKLLIFIIFNAQIVFGIDFSIGLIGNNYAFQACGEPVSNKLNTEGLNIVIEKKDIKNMQ